MPLTVLLIKLALQINVRSLMHEMVDWDRLASPLPYTHAQASSYDRRSDPGPNSDPFANGDAGQFIRIEQLADRKEYVMADLKGPGVVDRLWSANPLGTIRFYFDGETAPRLKADMADLLTGKIRPFTEPFGYEASHGTDLYFPFPYAKSLKITVDDSAKDKPTGLYYHIGYRTYSSDAQVVTYDDQSLTQASDEINRVAELIRHPALLQGKTVGPTKLDLAPGKSGRALDLRGHGVIRDFAVTVNLPSVDQTKLMPWTDPKQPHNILRQLILQVKVDGVLCVSTPLGDFFGSAPGFNPYSTLPASMDRDGSMHFRLPMPFTGGLVATIQNIGKTPVALQSSAIVDLQAHGPLPPFRLHAQWTAERGRTRPFKDMNLLMTNGPGNWVGCNLAVANPVGAWWGEGDEKVYVDAETFPSTFGTGTEDFFGYAWSSPDLFQKPYHAQSRADGPGNMGHSSVVRWQVFDPIPYKSSIKFDLERWHWADVVATYGRTAYWYAPLDSPGPAEIDKSLLLPEEIKPLKVEGAIEGESMPIVTKTGGYTEVQGGFGELSDGKQLWWRDATVGDRLVMKFSAPAAGLYEIVAQTGNARDYGRFLIRVNGEDAGRYDFYLDGLEWKPQSLGTFTLPEGESTFEVVCLDPNPAALKRNMFGLDYLLLKKR